MKLLQKISCEAKALLKDEQGASMIEYILIIAAIALPLIGVLIYFKDDIAQWVKGSYEEVKTGDAGEGAFDD